MREKLIELLNECDSKCENTPCDECEYCDNRDCNRMMELDHLIANGVTIQRWIPVYEPPKKDGRYLVAKKIFNKVIWQEVLSFAKDGRKVDKYDFHREWKNVWYRYDGEWGHLTIDDVTHWMPLPLPPKEGE